MPKPPIRIRTTTSIQTNNTSPTRVSPPPAKTGRRARIGLIVLLCLTVLFAAGALFIKYQLEELRVMVQTEAEKRLGGALEVGAVTVNGLRGLRADNFHVTLKPSENSPEVEVHIPRAYVYINAVELLYGQLAIDRVEVQGAQVAVHRPADGEWFHPSGRQPRPLDEWRVSALPLPASFRVVGKNCALDVFDVVDDTGLHIDTLDFDLSRLAGADEANAAISGQMKDAPAKRVAARCRFASLSDFDLRVQGEDIAADDVNVFLPASQHVVRSGTIAPKIRVNGYPGDTLMVSLDLPFTQFALRDQPEFLPPVSGSLVALAQYDIPGHLLSLTTARADTDVFGGSVTGTVSFAQPKPEFDIRVEASQLPFRQLFDAFVPGLTEKYGKLDVEFPDPRGIFVTLKGSTEAPVISAEATVNDGKATFTPSNPQWPSGSLVFGVIQLGWNSGAKLPTGTITVVDGEVSHAPTKMTAKKLACTLRMDGEGLTLDPLSVEATGNTFLGSVHYDLATQQADFTLNGTVSKIEKTPLHTAIKDLFFDGELTARCSGTIKPTLYHFEIGADVTQTQVDYDWWLRKRIGVGTIVDKIAIDITPHKKMHFDGRAILGNSPITATIDWVWEKGKFETEQARVKMDSLDIVTAGQCVRIPYAASGTKATGGYFTWDRVREYDKANKITIGGVFEDASFVARGIETPLRCRNAKVSVLLDNAKPGAHTSSLTLDTDEAFVPPLGMKWLLPLEAEDPAEMIAKGWTPSNEPNSWTYTFNAAVIHMPPWEGTHFVGEAFNKDGLSGLRHYSANVGNGTIEGSYIFRSSDNVAEMSSKWTNTPAEFLLKHLEFPDVLKGDLNGQIDYTMDTDDPGTLSGKGYFDVHSGEFSADYLRQQFKTFLEQNQAMLPPSLKFEQFRADVELDGDIVHTNNLLLKGQGITITGNGQYIVDGDMDYELHVAIAPETAEQMPMLQAYLNIEGHRLTQNAIELVFKIKGPVFKPSSEVVGLPSVAVTLVSGAGEVASEAMRVIDSPRQVFLDMLKTLGGIVGTGSAKPAPSTPPQDTEKQNRHGNKNKP